jgi:hypothetical protein
MSARHFFLALWLFDRQELDIDAYGRRLEIVLGGDQWIAQAVGKRFGECIRIGNTERVLKRAASSANSTGGVRWHPCRG